MATRWDSVNPSPHLHISFLSYQSYITKNYKHLIYILIIYL